MQLVLIALSFLVKWHCTLETDLSKIIHCPIYQVAATTMCKRNKRKWSDIFFLLASLRLRCTGCFIFSRQTSAESKSLQACRIFSGNGNEPSCCLKGVAGIDFPRALFSTLQVVYVTNNL